MPLACGSPGGCVTDRRTSPGCAGCAPAGRAAPAPGATAGWPGVCWARALEALPRRAATRRVGIIAARISGAPKCELSCNIRRADRMRPRRIGVPALACQPSRHFASTIALCRPTADGTTGKSGNPSGTPRSPVNSCGSYNARGSCDCENDRGSGAHDDHGGHSAAFEPVPGSRGAGRTVAPNPRAAEHKPYDHDVHRLDERRRSLTLAYA